jgi:hypothetical protein
MNDSTSRDALIARNIRWIEQEKLHPRTIDYAKLYANLTHGALRIMSQYEIAAEMDGRTAVEREVAMRAAWDNVIRYIRTLKPAFEESGRKAA